MRKLKEKFPENYAPAVAAAILVGDEVFSIQRQDHLSAFPGYHSFPGGKVDHDEEALNLDHPLFKDHDPVLLNALFREIEEELQFDLKKALESDQILRFEKIGTSCTPPIEHRWFCAHYYFIELKEKPVFQVEIQEIHQQCWRDPQELLDLYYEGRILAVEATIKVLHLLSELSETNTHLKIDIQTDFNNEKEIVVVEPLYGIKVLPVRSRTLKPAERTNAYLFGDENFPAVLVDPSPVDLHELKKLKVTLDQLRVSLIFITHHHGDHYQHVSDLAKYLHVPIYLSELTKERIEHIEGEDYFNGIELQYLKEGDVITLWMNQQVIVHELPGHDGGQLGLASEDFRWLLVGDLIQGIGTVVVAAPYGDMGEYFDTLQKVLEYDPDVILPSHGIPMGGIHRVKNTLEHRLNREKTIQELLESNKSIQEMLDIIYPDLATFLIPYAIKNIEAHVKKLRKD